MLHRKCLQAVLSYKSALGLDTTPQVLSPLSTKTNMARGEKCRDEEGNSPDLDQYTKDALNQLFNKEQQTYDEFLQCFTFLTKGKSIKVQINILHCILIWQAAIIVFELDFKIAALRYFKSLKSSHREIWTSVLMLYLTAWFHAWL